MLVCKPLLPSFLPSFPPSLPILRSDLWFCLCGGLHEDERKEGGGEGGEAVNIKARYFITSRLRGQKKEVKKKKEKIFWKDKNI